MEHHEGETTPLLRHESSIRDKDHREGNWWYTIPFTIKSIPPSTLVPLIGSLTIFLNDSEFYVKNPAQLRVIEAMACLEHYSRLNDPLTHLGTRIPETKCKETPIQDRVAAIFGTVYVVRMVAGVLGTFLILTVFSTGRRRPVLILHKLNIVVSNLVLLLAYYGYPTLPLWVVCLNGASALFGGSGDLASSILFAAYADVIPDKTRRSNLIFISTSMQYVSQMVCLPMTSFLMNLDGKGTTPQLSVFVSMGIAMTTFVLLAFFMPETFEVEAAHRDERRVETIVSDSSNTKQDVPRLNDQACENPAIMSGSSTPEQQAVSPKPGNVFQVLREDFGLLRVTFLLLAMFFSVTGSRLIDWYGLLQYPSIKFHWTLSKTTYLICMQGILSFLNFTFILPAINNICQRRFSVSAESTSVGIAVVSALILTVSSIVFGLRGTTTALFIVATAVYTLGSGAGSSVQTYIVTAAPTPRSSGAVLSVVSLAATAGKFAASVIWPTSLHLGLSYPSGRLIGLPFFVNAVVLMGVAIAMLLVAGQRERNHHG